ncbi:MAG TPA: hypothetical protein ENJ19_07025 [Gammaproteobacteria bacterium]|nr:hypothetical protein [Gammaproteobacteria bacterium]
MKRNPYVALVAGVIMAFAWALPSAQASGSHGDGHGHSHSHEAAMASREDGMFLVKKEIDGYTVSFHVMPAQPGKAMGGSHDFMIKVEKGGRAITDLAMNTKVIHPGGQAEVKRAMKMGDWFMAGYDLGHPGRHQMMILFKTGDGGKHKGGVYYGK